MAKATLTVLVLIAGFVTGCRFVWDVPMTPRTDPCTGTTSKAYVYVATCEPPKPLVKIDGEPYRR